MDSLFAEKPRFFEGKVWIGGRWYEKDEVLESRHPANGERLGSFPICNPEDALLAVREGRRAAPAWTRLDGARRRTLLEALLRLTLERAEELAQLVAWETGRPLYEVYAQEVQGVLAVIESAAQACVRDAPRTVRTGGLGDGRAPLLVTRSGGVAAVVSSFHAPLLANLGFTALVLAAGHTVVLKPSRKASLCGLKTAGLFEEAGFPAGSINILTGPAETGTALAAAGPDALFYLGSPAGARSLWRASEIHLPRVSFAVHGGAAAMVRAGADLEHAAQEIAWACCAHAGQLGARPAVVWVDLAVAPALREILSDRLRALRTGDPFAKETDIGPMVDAPAAARARSTREEWRKAGVLLVLEDEPGLPDPYVAPALAFGPGPGNADAGPCVRMIPWDPSQGGSPWLPGPAPRLLSVFCRPEEAGHLPETEYHGSVLLQHCAVQDAPGWPMWSTSPSGPAPGPVALESIAAWRLTGGFAGERLRFPYRDHAASRVRETFEARHGGLAGRAGALGRALKSIAGLDKDGP